MFHFKLSKVYNYLKISDLPAHNIATHCELVDRLFSNSRKMKDGSCSVFNNNPNIQSNCLLSVFGNTYIKVAFIMHYKGDLNIKCFQSSQINVV